MLVLEKCDTGQTRRVLHSQIANVRLLHASHEAQQQRIHFLPLNFLAMGARLGYCSVATAVFSANHSAVVRQKKRREGFEWGAPARNGAGNGNLFSALHNI
jgi:hypothetical protein